MTFCSWPPEGRKTIGREPTQQFEPKHELRWLDRPNRHPKSTLWTCNGCSETWETEPDDYLHVTNACPRPCKEPTKESAPRKRPVLKNGAGAW